MEWSNLNLEQITLVQLCHANSTTATTVVLIKKEVYHPLVVLSLLER